MFFSSGVIFEGALLICITVFVLYSPYDAVIVTSPFLFVFIVALPSDDELILTFDVSSALHFILSVPFVVPFLSFAFNTTFSPAPTLIPDDFVTSSFATFTSNDALTPFADAVITAFPAPFAYTIPFCDTEATAISDDV